MSQGQRSSRLSSSCSVIRCVHATLQQGMSVRPFVCLLMHQSVGWFISPLVGLLNVLNPVFFLAKMGQNGQKRLSTSLHLCNVSLSIINFRSVLQSPFLFQLPPARSRTHRCLFVCSPGELSGIVRSLQGVRAEGGARES